MTEMTLESPDQDSAVDEQPMGEPEIGTKQVPVSEARRYRKRAQAAEALVEQLQQELDTQSAALTKHKVLAADLQLRQTIDDQLVESHAVDLETTRLLIELALKDMPEPDVARAVSDLRQRKPFLFTARGPGHGALSPKTAESPHGTHLDQAAAEACATGRRQDLLQYLRLRRRR